MFSFAKCNTVKKHNDGDISLSYRPNLPYNSPKLFSSLNNPFNFSFVSRIDICCRFMSICTRSWYSSIISISPYRSNTYAGYLLKLIIYYLL